MAKKTAKTAKKTAKKVAKKTTAKAATKPAKTVKAKTATKKAAAKPAAKADKPQTLSKAPASKAKTKKKTTRGRVKSVATLKRAGLLRGKQTKKSRNSAPEKLVEAQLEKLALKWEALHAKADAIPSEIYNMRKTFQPHTGLKHKTLGWGFIIDNKNDRLEVLFQDGIRYLISNYK